jgi:hypothetical protein
LVHIPYPSVRLVFTGSEKGVSSSEYTASERETIRE